MGQSVISQPGYPKKIVFNNDTVVAITIHQVGQLNQLKIDRAECLEVSDSLSSRIDLYKMLQGAKDTIELAQERQIQACTIALMETSFVARKFEQKYRKQKRRKNFYKFMSGLSTVAVAILLIPILL